jgi:hypothetical protein
MIIKSYEKFLKNLSLLANAAKVIAPNAKDAIKEDVDKDKLTNAVDKTKVTNPNDPNGILKDTIKKIAVDDTKSIKYQIDTATKIDTELKRILTSIDTEGNLTQKDDDVKKYLDEILKKNPGNDILKDLITSYTLKRELEKEKLKKKGTEDRIDTLKAREIEAVGKPTEDIKKSKSDAVKDLSEITKDIANISISITDAETKFNKNKKEMDQKLKNAEQESKGILTK